MKVNPKITIDDDYIDLRNESHILDRKKSSNGQKNTLKKNRSPLRTFNLKNEGLRYEKELTNCVGLRKLVISLKNTAKQHHRSHGSKRKNETPVQTSCDSRFRRHTENGQKRSLKSHSDLSIASSKKVDIESISPSTPLFNVKHKSSTNTNSSKHTKVFNNDSKEDLEEVPIKKRPITGENDIEVNIAIITDTNTSNAIENNPLKQNIDSGFKNQYPTLKRSWSVPVIASQYNSPNKNQCDVWDRTTYIYDEGSELDSCYLDAGNQQFFRKQISRQFMTTFLVLATCGILLSFILMYLMLGYNYLIEIFFKPRGEPETGLKHYYQILKGGVLDVITSIFSTVERFLSIPAA